MKEEQKQGRKPWFSTVRLGLAVVCFVVFMVVGLGAYYGAVGEFVTGELASLYALLALVGAAAVLLNLWWFAVPFYIGCAAAWVCGSYVGGLKGEFAPTAGGYTAAFCIILFSFLGLFLQWRSLRKRWRRWKEEKAREREAAKEKELAGERKPAEEKETAAELTPAAATAELPEEGSAGNGPSS